MILYFLIVNPFDGILFNILYIFNELILLISFVTILIINEITIEESVMDSIGIFLISLILISLGVVWGLLVRSIYNDFINYKQRAKSFLESKKSKNIKINYRPKLKKDVVVINAGSVI